jgi:hypothetical protein
MSSVDQVLVGRIGIAPPGQGNPTIILDSTTGTISGNFDINANVNFNEPGVNAIFESLLLSDEDIPNGSTDPRLTVQLGTSNDFIEIDSFGALARINADTSNPVWFVSFDGSCNFNSVNVGTGTILTNRVLRLIGPNSGVFVNTINNNPNLELYIPDGGGQVALYNSINANYVWRFTSDGGLTLSGNLSLPGNVNVGGVVNASGLLINGVPVEKDSAIPVFVNANYTVPNDGNDYELYIDGAGQSITVLIPQDPPTQQHINIVIYDNNFGVGGTCGVGTGVPGLQFVGKGVQGSTITLVSPTGSFSPGGLNSYSGPNLANTAVSLKYVNYGLPGDWWVWTA